MNHIIAEVEEVIVAQAGKKRQTLLIQTGSDMPIAADKVKFKQILYNLLSNAVKFTPEGGTITLEAEVADTSDLPGQSGPIASFPGNNSFLKLSVKDAGIGIRRTDLERVFDEFEQLEDSFSRKHDGTGLGLALTRGLLNCTAEKFLSRAKRAREVFLR